MRRSDLLIIGQAPSRIMKPGDPPLWGTNALTMLAKYSGVSPRERLYELADFINLIEEYPGPSPANPKYDAFPSADAWNGKHRVAEYIEDNKPRTVVTLGAKVAECLCGKRPEWFQEYEAMSLTLWREHDPSEILYTYKLFCSPHPGGTSMWWNDPVKRQQGTKFWTNLMSSRSSLLRSVDGILDQPQSERKTEMW